MGEGHVELWTYWLITSMQNTWTPGDIRVECILSYGTQPPKHQVNK